MRFAIQRVKRPCSWLGGLDGAAAVNVYFLNNSYDLVYNYEQVKQHII